MPWPPSCRASRTSKVGVSGGRNPACAITGFILTEVRLSGITARECEWITDMARLLLETIAKDDLVGSLLDYGFDDGQERRARSLGAGVPEPTHVNELARRYLGGRYESAPLLKAQLH
jgi:hypothetical protein